MPVAEVVHHRLAMFQNPEDHFLAECAHIGLVFP